MNLAGWRFLVFALAGAGAIVLLASLGTPGKREASIDRYTGKRLVVVRNVAEAIAEARRTGNVRVARANLVQWIERFPNEPVLLRYRAVLEAELAGTGTPPSPHHPEAEVLAAEQERARRREVELDRRLVHQPDRQALLALLEDLAADSAVAQATEEYFAPLARWRPEESQGPARPDELAARALRALETEPAPPAVFLDLARAFQSQERPRARMRWLLRGFASHPDDPLLREALYTAYLELGRVKEAFLVLGIALVTTPDDLALWESRARLAGWLSLHDAEIEARERLVAAHESAEDRERLVQLYGWAGRPEGGIPHARRLAQLSGDPTALERVAMLALQGGNVDLALDIFTELAETTGDERRWRERIIEYAWQSMRVDRVVAELRLLHERHPEGGYEERLEEVYRRRGMLRPLAELLEDRLARQPDDLELERETLNLYATLGDRDKVRELLAVRVQRADAPRLFFAQLPLLRAAGVEGVPEMALEMALSEQLRAEDAEAALVQLAPLVEDPGFREAARALADRFVAVPAARELLIYLVDRQPDDAARAAAAEELALAHPDQPELLRAWIERTGWAGDVEGAVRARESWRAREPGDGENLRALAHLYGIAERHGDAAAIWRKLTEDEGIESDAALALVEALFAAGQFDEAIEWLERRASLPGATVEERLRVADQLFGNERQDRALRFYLAALEEEPDHAYALLRVGQIRSWNNDPRGAIPFLARRLDVSDEQRAEVRFYLGESHWAIGQRAEARRLHELALDELSVLPERELTQDVMVAKMLARLGRIDEARPVFEHVIAAAPRDIHVLLDYCDSMVAVRDATKARELVERAKELAPHKGRTLATEGKVLMLEERFEDAAAAFTETIRVQGPDAGTEAELGRALELAGEWVPAHEAYHRSLLLQPDNRDVAAALERLLDETARLLAADFLLRRAGDDGVLEARAQASFPWGDRTRLGAALGLGDYSGRAAAVNAGTTDVDETVFTLGLAAFRRFARQSVAGAGIAFYPGASGDAPVGAWADLRLLATEPYRFLELQAYGHLLLKDPAAAAGLGGRVSGVSVTAQSDVGKRFWASAQATYDYLTIEDPASGEVGNGRFTGTATFGWRAIEGGKRMANPPRVAFLALEGLAGSHLAPPPEETEGPQLNLWVTYQAIRLLGDQELANLIPVGTEFDYLTLGARGEIHLARHVGAAVEGYAGTDLRDSDPIFGVQLGLTWRPSRTAELFAAAGYGTALGRSGNEDSLLLRMGLNWRW